MVSLTKKEKMSYLAFAACFIAYVITALSRNTYTAAIAALVEENIISKPNAGTINALFNLFYGTSQIIGGFVSDKISPFKIIIIGLFGSVIANMIMALSQGTFWIMAIGWSISGIALFGMWPSIIRIIFNYITDDFIKKARLFIPHGLAVGTLLSYLVSSVILNHFNWSGLFWFSVIMLTLTLIFFCISSSKVKNYPVIREQVKSDNKTVDSKSLVGMLKILVTSGFFIIAITGIIRGFVSGIKSWVPTIVMELYGVSPGFGNLLATILLIVSLLAVFVVGFIYPKRCKNLCNALALLMALPVPFLLILTSVGKINMWTAIILFAVVETFANSAGQLYNVEVSMSYSRYNMTGTIAGLFNALLCLGGVITSYAYGVLGEHFGWNITILCLAVAAVAAVILLLITNPMWKKVIYDKGECHNE
ncbi:MAG: MFS transporter [Clostridia bacterium]|nr:MFS transporter [Clostridia bacterium]